MKNTTLLKVSNANPLAGFRADYDSASFLCVNVAQDKTTFSQGTVSLKGSSIGSPAYTELAVLPAAVWQQISSAVVAMLRATTGKAKGTQFKAGENLVDVMLGREIMVLVWAIELAVKKNALDTVPTIAANWQAADTHARWFFYMLANTPATNADAGYGWRAALFVGLSGKN